MEMAIKSRHQDRRPVSTQTRIPQSRERARKDLMVNHPRHIKQQRADIPSGTAESLQFAVGLLDRVSILESGVFLLEAVNEGRILQIQG